MRQLGKCLFFPVRVGTILEDYACVSMHVGGGGGGWRERDRLRF